MSAEPPSGGPAELKPGATVKCRVCAADVPADAARCPRCRAALGELPPCPHCRAIAGASPDDELRFRCDVCGGPRVPVPLGASPTGASAPSGREVPHLRAAEKARRTRAAWRAGGIASGLLIPLLGAFFLLVALLFGVGFKLLVAATFAFAPLVALLVFAISKSRAASREIAPALDAAWVSVAGDLARASTGSIAPAELATRLGIDEARAEELVALLDVDAIVSSPSPPMRIASPASAAVTSADDALAEAEEEAALTEVDPKTEAAPPLKR